jgi:putative membrane protein
MMLAGNVLTGLVALIHLYIVLLEMVWWTGPRGQKAFGTTPEFARETEVLAANQGLYNGFLVAGLVWGLVQPDPAFAWQIKLFFLASVAVAGLYGAATVGRKTLYIQTVPAALAILALVLA